MALYTSYYFSRELPQDCVKVSISVTKPGGVSVDEEFPFLSPESSVLWGYKDGRVSKERYTERYFAKLDANKEQVRSGLEALEQKYPGRDIVLLCWCKPGDFCHRHLLSDYCKRNFGMDIKEYSGNLRHVVVEQTSGHHVVQQELFSEEALSAKALAIVGSRDFTDYELMKSFLLDHFGKDGIRSISRIISGGARGADALAERFAKEHGIPLKVFPAEWDKYGKSAGFRRNEDIIKACDVCAAFWDGQSRGTKHDIDLCGKYDKELFLCKYREVALSEAGRYRMVDESPKPKVLDIWYSDNSEGSWLSNLAERQFVLEGRKFRCVEQYFQYLKAVTFKDCETASRILFARSGVEAKQLGKCVKGFRPEIWSMVRESVMEAGIRASFEQNPGLLESFKALGDVRFTHEHDKGYWSEAFPRILKRVQEGFLGEAQDRAVRDGILNELQGLYGIAKPTDELVGGRFASEFAGEVTWSRALDFKVDGLDGFVGLRFMDFKDCTNIYLLRSDGESVSVEKLSTQDLKYVQTAVESMLSEERVESFGHIDGLNFYEGNAPSAEDCVFVFGSNPVGINGNPQRGTGGAALVASRDYGVRQGEKMDNCMSGSGRAYGLVTVTFPGKRCSLTLDEISANFEKMYRQAERMPDKKFCVAYRHLEKPSLCGYTGEEMLRAIKDLKEPSNVYFSQEWATRLNEIRNERRPGNPGHRK